MKISWPFFLCMIHRILCMLFSCNIHDDRAHWSMSRFAWFLANFRERHTVVWWQSPWSDCDKTSFLRTSDRIYVSNKISLKKYFIFSGKKSNIFEKIFSKVEKNLNFQWFSMDFHCNLHWIWLDLDQNPLKIPKTFEKSTYLGRQRELGGETGHF